MRPASLMASCLLGVWVGLLPQPAHGQGTDEAIRLAVRRALDADTTVDARHIRVRVEDARVLLLGKVPTMRSYNRASVVARKVNGVKNVVNRLRVVAKNDQHSKARPVALPPISGERWFL